MPLALPRVALALLLTAACGGDGDGGPAGPVDAGDPPPTGCAAGQLPGGALYRACYPAGWNGDLIVYAHGYVRPDLPLAIPADVIDGVPVSTIVNGLGYAFATTSYRANGLVADIAVEDLVELEERLREAYRPDPVRTFIVGFSEGGLVAALALEQEPGRFSGALAACGPIGDFAFQIDYIGDFRAVFDYFFPGVLPGSPVESPASLQDDWEDVHVPAVLLALAGDPEAAGQLLAVTGAPVDLTDPATIGETVIDLLWYNAFATNDAIARLGGQPYDNVGRVYQGSSDDAALNEGIARYAADAAARAALGRFETTGALGRPMATLHTTGDPVVPAAHQGFYAAKVASAGAGDLLRQDAFARYGHCTFEASELLAAFSELAQAAPVP